MLRYIEISQWSYFGVPIAYGHSLQYLSHKLNDEIDLAPHTTRAHHNIIYIYSSSRNNNMNMQYVG